MLHAQTPVAEVHAAFAPHCALTTHAAEQLTPLFVCDVNVGWHWHEYTVPGENAPVQIEFVPHTLMQS